MKEMMNQTGVVVKGVVNGITPHQKGGFNVNLMVSGLEKFLNVRVFESSMSKIKDGDLCQLRIVFREWQGRVYFSEAA